MRVFVMGHLGLVGSAVLRCRPSNVEVITASRADLDLCSESQLRNFLIDTKPDAIIMAAAYVGGIAANMRNQKEFLLFNLEIQNNVMKCSSNLRIPNLIFLGSSCAYPKLAIQPIKESSLLSGPLETSNEGYAISKIAGIRLCEAIHTQDGLNYFSVMPTNLYGPNDNFDLVNGHVPAALMRKMHEAKTNNFSEVKIWGTGRPLREFMHVDDLASACWHLLNKNVGGQLINVGTGEEISIANFANLMAKVVGFTGTLKFDTSMPDGTPRKLLDVAKIINLGWKSSIELEEGLSSTYEWFQEALSRKEVRGY